jgi:hypothetical protein
MDESKSIPAFSFDKKGLFTSKTLPVCVINPHDWAMLAPSDPVLAERERCAKIESEPDEPGCTASPYVIAARIRSGE